MTSLTSDSIEELVRQVPASRIIMINGSLGLNDSERLKSEHAALDATEGDILCKINCPGGNFWAGLAIYNAFVKSKNRIIGLVERQAKSAGFIALQGCQPRIARRDSSLAIHWPVAFSTELPVRVSTTEAEYLDAQREFYRQKQPLIVEACDLTVRVLTKRSRFRNREELEMFLEAERIMNPAEAKCRGFIDEIID